MYSEAIHTYVCMFTTTNTVVKLAHSVFVEGVKYKKGERLKIDYSWLQVETMTMRQNTRSTHVLERGYNLNSLETFLQPHVGMYVKYMAGKLFNSVVERQYFTKLINNSARTIPEHDISVNSYETRVQKII